MDGMGCALASYLVGYCWGVFSAEELLYVSFVLRLSDDNLAALLWGVAMLGI
jgi:hypothetical protein